MLSRSIFRHLNKISKNFFGFLDSKAARQTRNGIQAGDGMRSELNSQTQKTTGSQSDAKRDSDLEGIEKK